MLKVLYRKRPWGSQVNSLTEGKYSIGNYENGPTLVSLMNAMESPLGECNGESIDIDSDLVCGWVVA